MTFTHMNKFASFQALNQPFPINLLYSLHVVVELSPKGTEALIKPQQLSAIGSFTLITQRKLVPKRIQKQKSLFTVQQRSRSNIKQSASGNHFNWTFHFVISQAKTPTLFLKRQPLTHQEALAILLSLETQVSVYPWRNTEMIPFTQV